MTMHADVESPIYATASQEVRASDAALGDEVADAGAVVDGAADALSIESFISSVGAFSEGGDNPLLSAPMLIAPAAWPAPTRPAPASAKTLNAPTQGLDPTGGGEGKGGQRPGPWHPTVARSHRGRETPSTDPSAKPGEL